MYLTYCVGMFFLRIQQKSDPGIIKIGEEQRRASNSAISFNDPIPGKNFSGVRYSGITNHTTPPPAPPSRQSIWYILYRHQILIIRTWCLHVKRLVVHVVYSGISASIENVYCKNIYYYYSKGSEKRSDRAFCSVRLTAVNNYML